ncbi:MAG: 3-isopropylmalate dehydrogenase [Alphaproteobacteria bacterium]|nr:3-isopropylmalate dehydrogenase [Alphaproteobacteria bacterium]
MSKNILFLPGDGIGPEIMETARRVMEWFNDKRSLGMNIIDDQIGGAAYEKYGTPLAAETLKKALEVDAVIMGAVGGPKWANISYDKRPEAGLLEIRKKMGLFANLRPAMVFDALIDASTMKPEVVRGLDIMILRELTGGVYFGEPRGIFDIGGGERKGINTQVYTTAEIRRAARVAFELARQRSNRVCSCEKSNVMESGILWREEVIKLHAEEYGDVELSHMYADACAMQLLRNPRQFDVILTDNLFGDILSDEASMLTGSIGMLPSASLGDVDEKGRRRAMYEPIHGSAPDIAGRDLANPIATILSAGMMFRYSFGWVNEADMLELAVRNVLDAGVRTIDIAAPGEKPVGTKAMGDAVISALAKLS